MQDNQDNNRGIRPGVLIGIGAMAAVLVAAIAFSRKSPGPAESGVAVAPEPAVATRPAPPSPSPVRPAPTQPSAHTASPPAISPAAVATSVPPSESTNWEQRIDTILGSDQIDEAKKAEELLALFPNLPEEGQLEAIQHISNLLPDDRYAAITPMLTSAQTSEAVLEVLLTDLLNRPNELKLPALLQVARTPDHPKAADARDILEVFVDENYGNDWAKWESAVQKYLKENPE